jgi:hypothetical protein
MELGAMPTTFQHFIGSRAPTLPFGFAAYGQRPLVPKLPTALKANINVSAKASSSNWDSRCNLRFRNMGIKGKHEK